MRKWPVVLTHKNRPANAFYLITKNCRVTIHILRIALSVWCLWSSPKSTSTSVNDFYCVMHAKDVSCLEITVPSSKSISIQFHEFGIASIRLFFPPNRMSYFQREIKKCETKATHNMVKEQKIGMEMGFASVQFFMYRKFLNEKLS